LKIAFFVTQFPSMSETFIANQVIALQKCGHHVHIFSQHKPAKQKLHQVILDANLPDITYYLDDVPATRNQKILALLNKTVSNLFNRNILPLLKSFLHNQSSLSVYDFISFLDKPAYDVLHAHFGQNGNYVTQLRTLGLYKDAKFITTFHGYDLDDSYAKNNYYTALFQSCRLFTVNSLYSKKLLQQLGCDEDKIVVLPVGLDINKFKLAAEKISTGYPLRILFTGRLMKFKAPDRVLEICSILKMNNRIKYNAVIIGDGPMLPVLQSLIEEYELYNEVKIEGAKTQEEIIEIMAQSDIFLYPGITYENRAENQGLVLQEAQAMQLAVLVSDAGGMQEGVIDGVTGFVLPENDSNGFVEKIELLAADAVLRKKLGGAGRQLVKERFDIEILNIELLRLYQN
jgi:colanic acid/amylovoran biosynthesis glycosyltransferase